MTPYKVLYEHKCKIPLYWSGLSERKLAGTALICEIEEKVRTGDKVFLKVLPWRKVLCLSRKGKLSQRFIELYEILKRTRPIEYQLVLPPKIEKIHNVFHLTMLQWYRSDPSHVISSDEIELQPYLSYSKEPKNFLAREVSWHRNCVEEAMWESEEAIKSQYLNLFSGKNFKDEISLGESCKNPFFNGVKNGDFGISFLMVEYINIII
ncbi:Retrotransposon protein, Ty3-gypsy subclass [Gossypium australe]|uniref:Retrotransposon protein, Ty3-gypsy subclass n=1 Tax=Gossypium australe TaxID=47621 RepID=A0A5B6VYF6_9ROSI|nr:Retrotransposon protein, Ty3-gypsy subclass [Gossypium australe]